MHSKYIMRGIGICSITLAAMLTGCGGGGGSDAGISYTGSTSPASLTQTNSGKIISNGYFGGNSGALIGGSIASLRIEESAPYQPLTIDLSETLISAVSKLDLKSSAPVESASAAVRKLPRETVSGPCGGSASFSGSYNDVTGALLLDANFAAYCEDGLNLTGGLSVAGDADVDANNNILISYLTFTLTNFKAISGNESFTAAGELAITPLPGHSYLDNNISININMLIRDDTTTKVSKFEDFNLEIISTVATTSYDDITISGRYYDPDEGYVDFSSPASLRVYEGDIWPASGSIRAAGNNNSSATITALSNTTYQLDVDSDGDGLPDSTQTGTWSSL